MKKTIAILGASLLAVSSSMVISGCGKEKNEKTVMNLSLNPEIELILDENNVVVSANALNEEGNLILSAGAFVGKDAQEAASLFVEISADTGFLVKGNATVGDNELEISFSGDKEKASKLFNSVKTHVVNSLQAFNVQAKIELEESISKEDLQELAAECAPYLDAAEIKALEYVELIETVYESRKETVDLYSQELKAAYYEAKAIAMERAEIETLKGKVNKLLAVAVDAAYDFYSSAAESLEEVRFEQLVSADSAYQKTLASFREKKIEYLKLRSKIAEMEADDSVDPAIIENMKASLTVLDAAVEAVEKTLDGLGETANGLIDSAKAAVKGAYDGVISALESVSVKVNEHLTEIAEKQQESKAAFFTAFETEYAATITQAKQSWENMKTELETSINK